MSGIINDGDGEDVRLGGGCKYKGISEGDFYGDGIILYLDHNAVCTNLNVIKQLRTIHIHTSNGNFLVLLLYFSYVKCSHGGKHGVSVLTLQLL